MHSLMTERTPHARPRVCRQWTSDEISDKAGLEKLAKKLNPVIGYWGEPPPAAASPRRSPPSVEAWA